MGERKETLDKGSASGAANPPAGGANQVTSFSRLLQGRLASIEKRDWELWILALSMVAILAVGYFFVIFPAVFLGQRTISSTLIFPLRFWSGNLCWYCFFSSIWHTSTFKSARSGPSRSWKRCSLNWRMHN